MTMLLLETLSGTPGGHYFISANAQWAVGGIGSGYCSIWHIDPVAKTLLSTQIIAMDDPRGITDTGIAFGNAYHGHPDANAAMVTHTGTFSFLPQPGTGVYPQVSQLLGLSGDGTTPYAQLMHYNSDISGISSTIGWWTGAYPPGYDHNYDYPTPSAFYVPSCASDNGLFIAGWGFKLDTTLNILTTFTPSTSINCISTDGSTVGGYLETTWPDYQAVYWDVTNTMQTIGLPPGATKSATIGINSNGTEFVVWSDNGIYRWTSGGGFVATGVYDILLFAARSSDGSIVTESAYIDSTNVVTYTGIFNENIAYNFAAVIGIDHDPLGAPAAHPKVYVFFPTSANVNVSLVGVQTTAHVGNLHANVKANLVGVHATSHTGNLTISHESAINEFVILTDLWFSQTTGFVDLSIQDNRRKFITASGCTANLGNDGSTPFGVAPSVYLTGAGFTNAGIGGAFSISGSIAIVGDGPCCSDDISSHVQISGVHGSGIVGNVSTHPTVYGNVLSAHGTGAVANLNKSISVPLSDVFGTGIAGDVSVDISGGPTRVTHFNLIPNSITFGNDPVISDAGTEVVGMNGITNAPLYWSEAHGYEDLPIMDPAGMYLANGFPIYGTGGGGLSSDGSTVVGYYQNFDGSTMQLYYWRHGAGATTIPTPSPYTRTFAIGCNSDGTKIAGWLEDDVGGNPTVPFIWDGSFTILPPYDSHTGNFPSVFSDDGTTLAGNSYTSSPSFAWVWTSGTGYVLVAPPGGADGLGFTAISNDGNSIAGSTSLSNVTVHGFVWTRTGGLVDVGVLPAHVGPYAESQLFDISDDGSKAVGMSIDGSSNSLAVLWDGSTLTSLGYLVLNGSENTDTQATSISGDGSTVAVVGTTSDFANQQQPMTWTSGGGLVDLATTTVVGSVTTGPLCDWVHGFPQFRTAMSYDGSRFTGFYNGGQYIWKPTTVSCECG